MRNLSRGSGSVVELFRNVAREHPSKIAFHEGSESIRFDALWERIARFSTGLVQKGFGPGDRAIVMVPMSIDLYVVLLGVLKTGGTAVFLDPWVGWRRLIDLARFAGAAAWIGTTKSHIPRLFDSELRAIPLAISRGSSLLARESMASIESHGVDEAIHQSSAEDTALVTFTTGSSGTPKGVRRTHGILEAQHRALAAEFPAKPGEVDLCTFPVFALNNLALGVTTVIPPVDLKRIDRADPYRVMEAIRHHRVTTATASPPLFDALAYAASSDVSSSLRRILTGGAPVEDRQLQSWTKAFPDTSIEVVYGSTEAEPVAHLGSAERLELAGSRGYTVGRIASSVRAAVVRIDRGPLEAKSRNGWISLQVPHGDIGELLVTGDHVCRDYDRNPEAARENKIVDPEGVVWHRMGDTGWFDDRGRFRIAGRVHSTIVRNGLMIHPQLVEQVARGEDLRIRRAAAVGIPDPSMGERLAVVCESDDDVASAVESRLGDAEITFDQVLATSKPLPVDPRHNSKVDYPALRDMLMDGRV